jgi:hypothetical protein
MAGLLLLGVGWQLCLAVVNGLHLLLEIQEVVGDVVFGTSNVNGAWDSITDLGIGLIASVVVAFAWVRLSHRRGAAKRIGHTR